MHDADQYPMNMNIVKPWNQFHINNIPDVWMIVLLVYFIKCLIYSLLVDIVLCLT